MSGSGLAQALLIKATVSLAKPRINLTASPVRTFDLNLGVTPKKPPWLFVWLGRMATHLWAAPGITTTQLALLEKARPDLVTRLSPSLRSRLARTGAGGKFRLEVLDAIPTPPRRQSPNEASDPSDLTNDTVDKLDPTVRSVVTPLRDAAEGALPPDVWRIVSSGGGHPTFGACSEVKNVTGRECPHLPIDAPQDWGEECTKEYECVYLDSQFYGDGGGFLTYDVRVDHGTEAYSFVWDQIALSWINSHLYTSDEDFSSSIHEESSGTKHNWTGCNGCTNTWAWRTGEASWEAVDAGFEIGIPPFHADVKTNEDIYVDWCQWITLADPNDQFADYIGGRSQANQSMTTSLDAEDTEASYGGCF